MRTRFEGMGLHDAQELYREQVMALHPDNAETGDPEGCKTLNAEWQFFTAHIINDAFSRAEGERAGKTGDNSAEVFADILRQAVKFNVDVEIIGFWIYAFRSYEYREQLRALGFWFSAKHKAWIYSGSVKRRVRFAHTTDQNRAKWGSQTVASEWVEPEKIGA